MSKADDGYMDDILNDLNEDTTTSTSVSSRADSTTPEGNGEDAWFDNVDFEGALTTDSGPEKTIADAPKDVPRDEFSVDIDDSELRGDMNFDESVLGADPVISSPKGDAQEPLESVISKEDIASSMLDDSPLEDTPLPDRTADTEPGLSVSSPDMDDPEMSSDEDSTMPSPDMDVPEMSSDEDGTMPSPDMGVPEMSSDEDSTMPSPDMDSHTSLSPDDAMEGNDVDAMFSAAMFDGDDSDPSSDMGVQDISFDTDSASQSPATNSQESPSTDDTVQGTDVDAMFSTAMLDGDDSEQDSDDEILNDPLYDNMIGDSEAEAGSHGPVEDLGMVDFEDEQDVSDDSGDTHAVAAFSGNNDDENKTSPELDSLDSMEMTLSQLDSLADYNEPERDDIEPELPASPLPAGSASREEAMPEKEKNTPSQQEKSFVDTASEAESDSPANNQNDAGAIRNGWGVGKVVGAVVLTAILSIGGVVGVSHYNNGLPSLSATQTPLVNTLSKKLDALSTEVNALKSDNNAMAELKTMISTINTEQENIGHLVAQIRGEVKANKAQMGEYETQMVSRLEKHLSLMLGLSEKQNAQQKTITEQVMREVSTYLKDKEQVSNNNLEPLLDELGEAVARIGRVEARVREQAQLISMVENEGDYVKAVVEQLEKKTSVPVEKAEPVVKKQATLTVETERDVSAGSTTSNVAPLKYSAAKEPVLPKLYLTAVFEGRAGKYELYVQDEKDRGTPRSVPYVFTEGQQTVIPGYGRILRIEKIAGTGHGIHYQVVTEKGTIQGAI